MNIYDKLAARIMANPNKPNMSLHTARQVGKSAMLGAMYGTGPGAFGTSAPHHIVREHPLQYVSGYTFVNFDKRFGGVPVYKVVTKIISSIMREERVPHTELYYRNMDTMETQVNSNVVAIAWIRRANLNDLSTAVATLIMLGKEVVILRAFEP